MISAAGVVDSMDVSGCTTHAPRVLPQLVSGASNGYARKVPLLLRQLVTFVLVLSLMPGWMELLENLEHLAHDGHLAHLMDHGEDEDVASHDALEAEHGCTPISHNCGCHSSIPVLVPDDPLRFAAAAVVVMRERPQGLEERLVNRANAPPIPPPRA